MNFELDSWSRNVKIVTGASAAATIGLTGAVLMLGVPWESARNLAFAATLIGLALGMWETHCESGKKKDLHVAWVFLLAAAVSVIRI